MSPDVLLEHAPLFARAAVVTVRIAALGILGALAVGLVCAAVEHFRVPVGRQAVRAYVELARNTPLVVQLFFLYFALPKVGVVWSGEACAIIGLTFLGGGYMAEALRSGLDAVDASQVDGALSLGMSRGAALRHVVLPQGVAVAVPALTANVIFLVKETSVVSVVALPDLMYVAKDIIGSSYDTREALTLLVVAYLVILLPVALGARALEGRWRRAGLGS
ncbi:amino acid ABC transporter permease [Sanguibacter massiliensis]|uniref:amino acid ABC transporter permease n=1 Tax=Sanguibacter massiliensis TaxID=1973217 RepID=UPI000C846994|nr:amino acid ABC transporter permease [Sanguibacter massiliensis]